MNQHIALYRTWRPRTFGEMVGQEHVTQTLRNSLREGRISHAYLFSGPRGTGKTSAAKILAKAVNCERGPAEEPCNECDACRRIGEGSVMDVIELDAASNNGVDEIRDIRDKVKYAPAEVRRKVYIIDEVHMLTIGAFNALLKTLEEPPQHAMFILATTEPHKLPVTIASRCQRFDFRRVKLEDQVERLRHICREEGIEAEGKALQHIARLSDGGMRDAVSLLDQIVSFSGSTISYEDAVAITGGVSSEQFLLLSQSILAADLGAVLDRIESWMVEGKSAEKSMESLMQYFRDLLVIKLLPEDRLPERMSVEPAMRQLAESFERDRLFAMIEILNRYQNEMKYASQPQMIFEVALMKICSRSPAQGEAAAQPEPPADAVAGLERRLLRLEQQIDALSASAAAAQPTEARASGPADASAPLVPRHAPAPAKPAGGAAPKRMASAKLNAFVQGKDTSAFREILLQWSTVLSKVKDIKISVQAWLVNGEPVSLHEQTLLVAFKNTIHRETIDKPANSQLVEQVMREVFGRPLTLQTMMLKDWEETVAGGVRPEPPQEVLQLEPEDEAGGKYKEEWINEAIELFGEDMVEIKDDK